MHCLQIDKLETRAAGAARCFGSARCRHGQGRASAIRASFADLGRFGCQLDACSRLRAPEKLRPSVTFLVC